MKDLKPTISIVIPTYNTKKELFEKLINSLLIKQINELEIIVIDDASDDEYSMGIVEVLDKTPILKTYKKSLKEEAHGSNYARSKGAKLAKGKYVWFVDADDYIKTEDLDGVVSFLKNNDVDILTFNNNSFDENYNMFPSIEFYNEDFKEVDISKVILHCNSLCCSIYNKKLLIDLEYKFFNDILLLEDMSTAMYWLSKTKKVYACNKYLYNYYVHQDSSSQTLTKEKILSVTKAFDLVIENVDSNIFKKYHDEFEWKAIYNILYLNVANAVQLNRRGKRFVIH